MKQVDDIYENEELLYKPTKKKKKPKKANHKHVYENCVYDIVFDPAHGFRDKIYHSIGTYCSICGKIGDLCDDENMKWYKKQCGKFGISNPICHSELTEEAKREFDPATRTLPYFFVSDWFQKEVQLD